MNRYNFAKYPASFDELTAVPITFGHGLFENSAIDEFSIFDDGFVVSAKSSTASLDDFAKDVVAWACEKFDLKSISTQRVDIMYESQLTVRANKDLLEPLERFTQISRDISRLIKKKTNQTAEFLPFGLIFGADYTEMTGLKPVPFRLERKAGVPVESNLYFSSAPLTTQDHLKLLAVLDDDI